jgi:hypothetical protein
MPASSFQCFEIILKPFCHGQLWQPIQEPNDGWSNLWTPKPLLDFVLNAYFQQLEVSIKNFNQNQTRSLKALW